MTVATGHEKRVWNRLSRRRFLAGIVAILGGLLGWWRIRGGWPQGIISAVRSRLSYLDLDAAGLHAFAQDVLAAGNIRFPRHYSIYSRIPVSLYQLLPDRAQLERFVDSLEQQYLLSSDFFLHGADETRTIRYLTYYDPYRSPCRNFWRSSGRAGG
ncbi:MAG: hypothetical protein IPP90_12905 [Gemmatimonadaceae bacterium]|nr:hypothetical protein [Gemmatimonadaceae bacterium]